MCLEIFKELLIDPVVAIKKAKTQKNLNKTLIVLIFEGILFGLATFFITKNLGLAYQSGLLASSVVVMTIVCAIFGGFLIQLILTILGGKGKYFEGLTSLTYAKLPIATGVFISSLFVWLPIVGVLLSAVILFIFIVMGVSILYRSIRELFSVDLITAWISISIFIMGGVLTLYLTFILFATSNSQLMSLLSPMMG